jgi:hypothetical protein
MPLPLGLVAGRAVFREQGLAVGRLGWRLGFGGAGAEAGDHGGGEEVLELHALALRWSRSICCQADSMAPACQPVR